MKSNYMFLVIVFLILLIGTGTYIFLDNSKAKRSTAIVSRVIDGDTIKLQNGETVRLLGINTPEKGQPYYADATNKLKQLLEGKKVFLEKDIQNKDKYGRLLRYIFVNGLFVNSQMVKEGYAYAYIMKPNIKYENKLKEAEKEAKSLKLNIWNPPEQNRKNVCDNKCIKILYFNWNAKGDDCVNLNDEYVSFRNGCPYSCDLTNWTVKGESSRDFYTFPTFILGNNKSVTLYSGCGVNTESKLYWCNTGHKCNAVWNNNGDTLFLRNSNGKLVLSYSYTENP